MCQTATQITWFQIIDIIPEDFATQDTDQNHFKKKSIPKIAPRVQDRNRPNHWILCIKKKRTVKNVSSLKRELQTNLIVNGIEFNLNLKC